MTLASSQPIGIQLPLTSAARQIARQFSQECPIAEKAQQIRHNTLAVYAVNTYLQLMDVPTQLEASDSWHPVMRMMSNAADLVVPGLGKIACRAIAPEASICYVPPEDWVDRAGYIAVTIDETRNQATLVGFCKTIGETEAVPLEQFDPIESLIDTLHTVQSAPAVVPARAAADLKTDSRTQSLAPSGQLTQFRQWLEGIIASGWQAADTLISPAELNFAFRTSAGLVARHSLNDISRAKLIDLGLQLGQFVRVALVVHLSQTDSHRSDIVLQVRPMGDSPYLPEGLELTILDEQNHTFLSATARAIDNCIQLRLSGETGETFGVRVAIAGAEFIEQFII